MRKNKWLAMVMAAVMTVAVGCTPAADSTTSAGTQASTTAAAGSTETTTPAGTTTAEATTPEATDAAPVKVAGGTYVYPLTADPKVMNPLYAVDSDTLTAVNAMFAPLFVQDAAAGETRYYLAESVETSEDFLTYTVKLKDGLKWHDGETIDADDLIYTMETILDEDQKTHFMGYFMVDGEPVSVNKVDDLTVEFVLPAVSVPFLSNLERLKPLPEHYYGGEADLSTSALNAEPVGSGPFKFKEFISGQKVELERFDEYFDGAASLDNLVFTIITDPNSANTAVLNGELDARKLSSGDVDTFAGKEGFSLVVYGGGRVDNMVIKQTNEALQNKDVRQAIAYGIDKDEIIQGVFQGSEYASVAYSVFGPETLYHTEEVEQYERDVEKAKELLKGAGYESLDLRLAYTNTSEQLEATGLIMQQQLAEVGINLELMPLERGAFVEGLTNPDSTDFDLAFNGYNVGYEPNGYSPLFLSGQPNNFMKYENAELDQLWADGVTETDPARRQEIYETIQKTLIDDMALYPIDHPMSILVVSDRIGGVEEARATPNGFEDFSKLYILE